jgi:hypothetical protein
LNLLTERYPDAGLRGRAVPALREFLREQAARSEPPVAVSRPIVSGNDHG